MNGPPRHGAGYSGDVRALTSGPAALKLALQITPSVDVKVREVLEWYGARRRGVKVLARVVAELRECGFHVSDDFGTADIESLVRFHATGQVEVLPATAAQESMVVPSERARAGQPAAPDAAAPSAVARSGRDMLADFMCEVAVAPEDVEHFATRLGEEIRRATVWLEVGPSLLRGVVLDLSERLRNVPWSQFANATAGVYDWHERGPLWYSSPMRVGVAGQTVLGGVVFCRDGWWAPVGQENGFVHYDFMPWEHWHAHHLRSSPGTSTQLTLVGRSGEIIIEPALDDGMALGDLTLTLASAVLERVLPVAAQYQGQESMSHPPVVLWNQERLRSLFGSA